MVGAGLPDYGNIGVMPVRNTDKHVITDYGYRSKFDHKNENTTAGYYAVHLDGHNVLAELTVAGPYTGMHRYTFYDANKSKYVIIDPSHTVKKVCMFHSVTGWFTVFHRVHVLMLQFLMMKVPMSSLVQC